MKKYFQRKKAVWIFLIAVAAVAIALAAIQAGHFFGYEKPYESTGYAMGTIFQQTVSGGNAREASKDAMERVNSLEKLISWKISDSDIARLNRSAGSGSISVDSKTAALLRRALEIAGKSGGAYDPTILPVSSLWNFDGDAKTVPDAAKLEEACTLVDYRRMSLTGDGKASLSKSGMGIDLGGIGKGAACDEAVAAYRAAGVKSAVFSAGSSSIGLYGTKSDGSPWRIAVRDPETPDSDAGTMGTLSLQSGFVSTSGIYERCFRQNGVLYHHLLNPKTGYPERNGLASVTVVAGEGVLSDGLSTACFVLGREKGEALLRSFRAEGIFIGLDGHVTVTDGLKGKFEITSSKYTGASS